MKYASALLPSIAGLTLVAIPAFAAWPTFAVDFDTVYNGGQNVNTQSGFESFQVGNSSGAVSASFGPYTVTVVGGDTIAAFDSPTASMNSRFRGIDTPTDPNFGDNAIPDSGSFTLGDLWTDRLAVTGGIDGDTDGSGTGLYIKVEGLDPNRSYDFQVWAGDPRDGDLDDLNFYGFDATFEAPSGLVALGNYEITGSPATIADDSIYSISSILTTDNFGTLIYKAVNVGDGPNGIANGFSIFIPEPSSSALLIGALAFCGGLLRRR